MYFAIGMKKWVELREGAKAPRRVESAADKVGIQKRKTGKMIIDGVGPWGEKRLREEVLEEPIKTTFKVVHYIGGKVIGHVTAHTFALRVGLNVRPGQLFELPPESLEIALGKVKRVPPPKTTQRYVTDRLWDTLATTYTNDPF